MRTSLLLFLVVAATALQAGGPWPQPKGKAYLKLSEWWLRFDEHYTDQGELDPNLTSGLYNTTLYAEYGLTDRLTTVVHLPVFSRNVTNNEVSGTTGEILAAGETLNGIGDAELSVRYALTAPGTAFPLAVSLTLGLPLGEERAGVQGNLQTGDGEFNQMLSVHGGGSFSLGAAPAYWSARLGVNNRSNGFSDEFRWGVEAGTALANEKLWLVLRLNGTESFFNGETAETNQNTSIFANNAEFISPGVEVNYYVTNRFGISAGVAGAVAGKVIAAAPAYSVGVFADLGK